MIENIGQSAINDRIWITSRVRMISERKALRNNFWSLVLMTYYSLVAVLLSVFSGYYNQHYGHFDDIVTSASIAVLVTSLVVSGFRFEKAASLYRDCYLSLQRLSGQAVPEEEKETRYNEILSLYPNHTSSDYHDFLVTHTYLEKKKVWNGSETLSHTRFMLTSFVVRKLAFFMLITIFTMVPIVSLFGPVVRGIANDTAPAL